MSYYVGEVLLMEYEGWLKAFKVVSARQVNDHEIEYDLTMLDNQREWEKPG